MSKGLEALERIKLVYQCTDMAIIEKELKRLEELDNGPYVSIHINRYMELCDKEKAFDALSKDDEKAKKLLSKEIEKNRVLEIINKLGIKLVIPDNDYSKEHITIEIYRQHFTKEQWEMLKKELDL